MRAWVVVLLVANLTFFVWSQGWVSPWLPAPWQGQREPQRVFEQVNPERVAVRRMPAASEARAGSTGGAQGAGGKAGASTASAAASGTPPGTSAAPAPSTSPGASAAAAARR